MTLETLLIIIGMSIVTFTPRVTSIVWFRDMRPNAFWKRFFNYIPYAMLSVLVFPDVFSASGRFDASLVGVIAAIGLSLRQKSATTVVLGAVISIGIYLAVF